MLRSLPASLAAFKCASGRPLSAYNSERKRKRNTDTMKAHDDRRKLGKSWQSDSDKPYFHVMPRDGWLNDPNGPIYYKGRYHVFYQHVVGSSTWSFGLVWGHASSADLVTWEHEPVAIEPTRDGYDADGCWSGNTAIDSDGTPTILYTGVRLRDRRSKIPLPPAAQDLHLEQIEAQCSATCSPDDDRLLSWKSAHQPIIPLPPAELGKLTGFRDPFVFQSRTGSSPWKMIVGSGTEAEGGTILVYHSSDSLPSGWEFKGRLETGKSKPCQDGETLDLGQMWECPFFTQLTEHDTGRETATWVLCTSPYPHHLTDRPTNPCLYWLAAFEDDKFQIGDAPGPKMLDVGDILYAPTIFKDGKGRCIMFAWLQELRKGGSWDYAGCLSSPRILTLQGDILRQDPAEELTQLRDGPPEAASDLPLREHSSVALPAANGQAHDVTIKFYRGQSKACGILLRAWLRRSQEGVECAEALLIDWEKSELQIVALSSLDTETMAVDSGSICKRIGGPIKIVNDSLQLRILIDHSVVEAFTEHGQCLTTRVYRADPPKSAEQGFFGFAFGGDAEIKKYEAFRMKSIWRVESDVPDPEVVYDNQV